MHRPTEEQLACLSPFERFAFELSYGVNHNEAIKDACHTYLSTFGASWVDVCTRKLRYVQGIEHIRNLKPDRGVVLASNHRSFFDLYAISSVVCNNARWVERMYFPVRSSFFYERPMGIFVNGIMSALAMYPPIMRDGSKRAFNQYSLELMVELMKRRGALLGIHPEGTRGKGDDPYEMLPAHFGVGQIVYHTNPIVVPAFTLGLINDFPRQVRSNFDNTGAPITITFGPPVDLSAYQKEEPKLRTYKRIADHLRTEISKLGEQDKAMRKKLGLPDLTPPAPSPRQEGAERGRPPP